jgi:uncharacterized protein DUF6259
MHQLSYDPRDPVFTAHGLHIAFQVFTFENVYGLARDRCIVNESDGAWSLRCDELTWAGGTERAQGCIHVCVTSEGSTRSISVSANCNETIRCIKVILKRMPAGPLVNLREAPALDVPSEGLILPYPSGWRGLYTPLIALATGEQQVTYVRSLDTEVRQKRFVLLPTDVGLDLELIFEESAVRMTATVDVPIWEIGVSTSLQEVLQRQMEHVQSAYHMLPWEARPDVPRWARDIALVAAIHCQHWSGYVFNDYANVLNAVEWLTDRIDGSSLLVYLPGWEGRYYWQYGDYRPDPRMGGDAGFSRLIDGIHARGAHVMPMVGIDHVNRGLASFEQWGAPATISTPGGFLPSGSVDWDTSRHHDHGWESTLNPAAPTWQNRLVGQIRDLIDQYGADGIFLDISAGWTNDPRHEVYPGLIELVARIRDEHPDVLVAGEGWYDAMGAITPLVQSGHTEGSLHWHDEPYAPFFDRYCRSFAHLCLGDLSRGSTGVHELGTNWVQRAPVRAGIIPTVTIVDGTIEQATSELEAIINDARQYRHRLMNAVRLA